jgi:hypothetical protein
VSIRVTTFETSLRSNAMQPNIAKEVADMRRMTTGQLRQRYADVFGEATNANNKAWLIKRIGWRLQALVEGDISERARRRAAELANDADLRLNPPVARHAKLAAKPEPVAELLPLRTAHRLPPPGSIISRPYKGEVLQVRVLDHGFEFEGAVYASLSAVARKITGGHCNGYAFFRLGKEAV